MADLQTLANIGEIVGAITVVLSLIYLDTQIRQNTQAQRSENYSRALDRLAAMQSVMAQNEELRLMFSKGAVDPEQLTARDRIRFTWRCYETFGVFEFMFHASKSDALGPCPLHAPVLPGSRPLRVCDPPLRSSIRLPDRFLAQATATEFKLPSVRSKELINGQEAFRRQPSFLDHAG